MRFSQRKDNQFYQPDHRAAHRAGAAIGYVRVLQQTAAQSVSPGQSRRPRCWIARRLLAHRRRKVPRASSADPACTTSTAFPACPPLRNLTGGLNTQNICGSPVLRPPVDQSAVPESHHVINPKVNYSWIKGRHTLKVGYEIQASFTPRSTISTRSTGCRPMRRVQQADLCATRAGDRLQIPAMPPATTWRTFMFGLPSQVQLANYPGRQLPPATCYFVYVQDDFRVNSQADAEPRLALGVRHAALGARQRAQRISIRPPIR